MTFEEAGRMRSILLQAHDSLVVSLGSLERAIAALEESWPSLGTSGRIGAPQSRVIAEAEAVAFNLPTSELRRLLSTFGDEHDRARYSHDETEGDRDEP